MLGTPDPIAFTIFGFEVRWYALLIVSALLLGFYILRVKLKKNDLSTELLYDIFIAIVPIAILCARLYYVAFELDYYLKHPSEILAIWNGGLAIHGAILGGLFGLYILCRKKKLLILQILDIIAPSLILGQAIGRWGNYFNMEAHGRITDVPWAITVYDNTLGMIKVHPTFLYESLWDFMVFFVLMFVIEKKKKYYGEVICWYSILYSIGRCYIEGLRTDSLYFMGLRIAQLVSLLGVLIGIVLLIIIKKKHTPIEELKKIAEKADKAKNEEIDTKVANFKQATDDNTNKSNGKDIDEN